MWFRVCGLGFVVCGLWFVVCGLWFAVCGLRFVVCGLWFAVCMTPLCRKLLWSRSAQGSSSGAGVAAFPSIDFADVVAV